MSIILNEYEWAKEMIEAKSLGKKPSKTLSSIAKYYIHNKDYSKSEARKALDDFLLKCDPGASLPKWSGLLDFAVKQALKYDGVIVDCINITKPEMAKINEIQGTQARRLAFTLLCLSKYYNEIDPKCNNWVNSKDSEIMHMANINTSIKRQSLMYHKLREEGFIQFSKKVDNINVRVCFAEEGETALKVNDFRNLGFQYLKYRGEPYFECGNCGIVTKISSPSVGRKQKYCKECAIEVKTRQNVNSVMKQRGKRAELELIS